MRGNKARMKPTTIVRRLALAERYLELEASEYISDAKDETDEKAKKEWGKRASRMTGAARDLKEIAGYFKSDA